MWAAAYLIKEAAGIRAFTRRVASSNPVAVARAKQMVPQLAQRALTVPGAGANVSAALAALPKPTPVERMGMALSPKDMEHIIASARSDWSKDVVAGHRRPSKALEELVRSQLKDVLV
jgi:hypothetical protein